MEYELHKCEDCGYGFESSYSQNCPLCDTVLHEWNEDSINENIEIPDYHKDYNHWKDSEGNYKYNTQTGK